MMPVWAGITWLTPLVDVGTPDDEHELGHAVISTRRSMPSSF
jgi:hypothetical protein